MDWAQWSNIVTSGLIALCSALFICTYHVAAPWRSTPTGRHVMTVTAVIGLFGAYTVLIYVWPTGTPAQILRVVRVVVGLWMAELLLQRTWMVVRAQREGARAKPPTDDEE